MEVQDLPTPALIIEQRALEANVATMAAALPGSRLRPHVKAHKCTALAARQRAAGHHAFTCATPREVVGMAAAGFGDDLLLANEVVDPRRLEALAALSEEARVTIAVDSEATIDAAALAGIREVLIDVDVGLPRCGCDPADAGRLAARARSRGLTVRGVMGYEGHLMAMTDRAEQREQVEAAMAILLKAHEDVGGEVISAGGTGTYDLHATTGVTEVQAGSYALMDTAYAKLGLPFQQAVFVVGTVISVRPDHAVADVGLKALGMDHGNPSIDGARVWFCSDEHVTFAAERRLRVGDRVRVVPAHVDPTVALHEVAWLVDGDRVVERWPIDLRGWG
jgi:D-serine deaminase-like pyridoxal phosphate-dependent protein